MRTQESEKAGLPAAAAAKGRQLFHSLAACFLLYIMMAAAIYGEPKSVTVKHGTHAYQTFKTTQEGETHTLNINKATTAPNIARSLITAQDTQDQIIWKPARIETEGQTHTYTMTGTKLNEPLWVEIEGEFVKSTGGSGVAGVVKPDFEVRVNVVEFDNVWVRNLNSLASDNFPDYEKCIAIGWDAAGEIDLEDYLKINPEGLTFDDVDDVVSLEIETRIFGSGSINGSVLDYSNTDPGDANIYAFAVRLLCGGTVSDRLIVVIFSGATQTAYQNWTAGNAAPPGWLGELPAVHGSLGANNTDPEPGAPEQWGGVEALGNNYHYNAAFEMRSVETDGGHGHQTCYDAAGNLIEDDGVGDQIEERRASCGTADAHHWTDMIFLPTHFSDDVQPFIRAAQLDGNPVDGVAALNNPLIRWGANLQTYLSRRPPHTANKVP